MPARSVIALHPSRFGRRPLFRASSTRLQVRASNDLRLFAGTFASGFLFVSILIA
jgi:hypothetical protein